MLSLANSIAVYPIDLPQDRFHLTKNERTEMKRKIKVIKQGNETSAKKTVDQKVLSKENFRNWVADWQSGARTERLPSLKDLFSSQST